MIPTFILTSWLLGLLSVAMITGAVWLGREWYARSWDWDGVRQRSVFAPDFGWNEPTLSFAAALLLGLIVVAGGSILRLILRLTKPKGKTPDEAAMTPIDRQRLSRPDGSVLQVAIYGPQDAPPLVLTHGWGLSSEEWAYAHRGLARHFRLITWDLAGLGESKQPENRDFELEKFAHDLKAVLALAGQQPAILIGHSIGGMTVLTFCRLFPEMLGAQVAGLVLTHTTYTNPVRTTSGAAFFSAIEKPVLVPLMYLTIALSPLLRVMNWLSYLNGSAHLSAKRSGFAGTETWEQIELCTRLQTQASPAVIARGMLGMMKYDATGTLPRIPVPTLVVAGDQDSTCKPEASERMGRDIPNARLMTLAPARHVGLMEHHDGYVQFIQEFVRTAVFKGPF